jgi:small conductance mechanosensitive channel
VRAFRPHRGPGQTGHGWRDFGVARRMSRQAVRRARLESLVLLPVLVGVVVAYDHRRIVVGPAWDTPVRALAAAVLVALGWQLARDVGRALGPVLLRRLEPSTAGTLGFILRLVTMVAVVAIALRIADLDPRTVALGGAITAVVVGLAAQQTLGNAFAGTVLVSARTFDVGERIRLQGGPLAGSVEGVVSSVGLLYTTLVSREGAVILVPNSVVLNVALVPLREPQSVHLRARVRAGLAPSDVEKQLVGSITTPLRGPPRVELEELDGDDVVVRISATPLNASDGAKLAREVLETLATHTAQVSEGASARSTGEY